MVASSLGAEVTIVERAGLGGSAVLTDVVPSKTLIATADTMTRLTDAHSLGVEFGETAVVSADLHKVNQRLLKLALEQSSDIRRTLERAGVRVIIGTGKLLDNHRLEVEVDGETSIIEADAVLISVGAHPRELPSA